MRRIRYASWKQKSKEGNPEKRVSLRSQRDRKRMGRNAAAAHSAVIVSKCLPPRRNSHRQSRGSVAAMITMMIRVVAGIIERDGRVLICQRQAGGIFGGKWEFPGGKMRPSEAPRQALERELREELGVAPTIGDLLQTVRYRYAEMRDAVQISFLSAALDDPPRNLTFARIIWAGRAELPRYDFLAADRQVISRLVRVEI
jgi:8-oxo-dGTP diphosphatase